MGKSPGKWIKTVLFGKKNSKTQLSKNVTADKKSSAKKTVEDPADSMVISDPSENVQLEKGSSGITACATDASFPVNRDDVDSQSNSVSIPLSDAEMQRQEQAAAKAQAAFRGHMARRAFRALKGIIRLQALIRGHLVRRQAVSTLHCMQAIVKLQALARGRQKGTKLVTIGADSFFQLDKLAKNVFVRKLLISLPTTAPLSLQYDLAEPNSAWNWLERWSLSHLCGSPTQTKKALNAKPQRKSNNGQVTEPDLGKSKRTIRKVSTTTNGDNNGEIASVESDKPKRNPRKITQTDSVQDPQSELERVKRNLKKVSASAAIASEKSTAPVSEKSDIDFEKPKIVTNSELDTVILSKKLADSEFLTEKPVLVEASSEKAGMEELADVPNVKNLIVETHSSENGEKSDKTQSLNGELSVKGEESGKENLKMRKRRSLPAKHEFPENISQNTQSVPSYMLATQSAKAKLRAQGSVKIGEDGSEYNHVRRHSLPAFTNSKLMSLSPRTQKPVQANGKGGIKTNKSMTSSRDDKGLQRGWRR